MKDTVVSILILNCLFLNLISYFSLVTVVLPDLVLENFFFFSFLFFFLFFFFFEKQFLRISNFKNYKFFIYFKLPRRISRVDIYTLDME